MKVVGRFSAKITLGTFLVTCLALCPETAKSDLQLALGKARTPDIALDAPSKLRVLTYNVWALPHLLLQRAERLREIAKRLPETGADLVALQETFHSRARVFTSIPEYPHYSYGPGSTALRSSSGLLLLSKHPIQETAQLVYSQCAGADCLANKGALYARVATPSGEIDVITTHMNASDGGTVRDSQVSELLRFVEQHSGSRPLVLLGDFNFVPDSPAYQKLLSHAGARDAYVDYLQSLPEGHALGPWDHDGFTADPRRNTHLPDKSRSSKRIDFTFFRQAAAHRLKVLASKLAFDELVDGFHLSDHFGVMTDLEIERVPTSLASDLP